MAGYRLDVSEAADVSRFAAAVVRDHPARNAVINNAGIIVVEDLLADAPDDGVTPAPPFEAGGCNRQRLVETSLCSPRGDAGL